VLDNLLFWEGKVKSVVSVESDARWYKRLKNKVGTHVELFLIETANEYVGCLANRTVKYDIIVIDGINRKECCLIAPTKLQEGGMIILDNSERYPEYAQQLRESGLLQVDLSGFGPVNSYTWTTSIFFHRAFNFPHKGQGRPERGIGSIRYETSGHCS
jgi:hypothetical protein